MLCIEKYILKYCLLMFKLFSIGLNQLNATTILTLNQSHKPCCPSKRHPIVADMGAELLHLPMNLGARFDVCHFDIRLRTCWYTPLQYLFYPGEEVDIRVPTAHRTETLVREKQPEYYKGNGSGFLHKVYANFISLMCSSVIFGKTKRSYGIAIDILNDGAQRMLYMKNKWNYYKIIK